MCVKQGIAKTVINSYSASSDIISSVVISNISDFFPYISDIGEQRCFQLKMVFFPQMTDEKFPIGHYNVLAFSMVFLIFFCFFNFHKLYLCVYLISINSNSYSVQN